MSTEGQNYADAIAGVEQTDVTEPDQTVPAQQDVPAEPEPETQDEPTDDLPELPENQQLAFKKRLEHERAKLEQQLRAEIEAETQQRLIQQLQGGQAQQAQLNYQQIQQQVLERMQRDPVGTIYQLAQVAAQQVAAPLIERNRQMARQQRVADLALKYGEELEQLAPYMKTILDKHPEWWDTDDGLELAYRWAKVEAGGSIAQQAVARERQQQQQLNAAKNQARAASGQAQSVEGTSPEDEALAYAEQLLKIR